MSDVDRFGYSLALMDGDLALQENAATGTRQLSEIAGTHNLLQALELRILTPFGSDMFNTTYGLDVQQAFTQPGGLRMVKELIKLNLVRTLGTDPRVRDIREVVFEDDPEYRARHPELTPADMRNDRHRRFWQVEVIIETVDDQAATLAVNIGA